MTTTSPTIARRVLGTRFRLAREARKLTRARAGAELGMSGQTIQRIEEGTQGTKKLQVNGLVDLYAIPKMQASELHRLALDGNKRGWWQPYKKGLMPELPLFLETEQEASHIFTLETEYIPGLLQTPEYLKAVQALWPIVPETASAVRSLRTQRQDRLFDREELPRMTFLIGCAALHYLDAMPTAKEGQLDRLKEVAAIPEVDVRIMNHPHAAMSGSFNILTPGPPLPGEPFVFIDALDGGRYVEDRDVVSLYERTFEAVREIATPIEEFLT
ncbi:helix-turn-helix domain-containing protein [Stackebrandtia soli]|uniref:helix-turn-helix domain-containing protein n=1 Tax=Stackebrandtia soli TaxID=1892856 RepID=UPI0039E7AB74